MKIKKWPIAAFLQNSSHNRKNIYQFIHFHQFRLNFIGKDVVFHGILFHIAGIFTNDQYDLQLWSSICIFYGTKIKHMVGVLQKGIYVWHLFSKNPNINFHIFLPNRYCFSFWRLLCNGVRSKLKWIHHDFFCFIKWASMLVRIISWHTFQFRLYKIELVRLENNWHLLN